MDIKSEEIQRTEVLGDYEFVEIKQEEEVILENEYEETDNDSAHEEEINKHPTVEEVKQEEEMKLEYIEDVKEEIYDDPREESYEEDDDEDPNETCSEKSDIVSSRPGGRSTNSQIEEESSTPAKRLSFLKADQMINNVKQKGKETLKTSSRRKNKYTKIDMKHKCDICPKIFQKLSQIERHMRVHSGEKPFVCKICERGFSQKGSLQIHMSRHTGVKPYNCTLCDAKFSQKGNLRTHISNTHWVSFVENVVFSCTECSCIFRRLGDLNAHMTRNHSKIQNDVDEALSHLNELQKTTNNALNSTNNDIILQSNISEMSGLNSVVVTSEEPNSSYVTQADGRRAGSLKWNLCSFCPKKFKKPSDLVRHLRIHTQEKPFVCKICGKSFAVKATLTTHSKTHKIGPVKDVPKSPKRRAGSLKWNLCSFCPKKFQKPSDLVRHIRIHTREKPFVCKVCGKSFAIKATLTTHLKTHKSGPVTGIPQPPQSKQGAKVLPNFDKIFI